MDRKRSNTERAISKLEEVKKIFDKINESIPSNYVTKFGIFLPKSDLATCYGNTNECIRLLKRMKKGN